MSTKALARAGSLPEDVRNEEAPVPTWKQYKLSKKRWERMVLASYLRVVCGGTVERVAASMGTSSSSINRLANHRAWKEAIKEAEHRWVVDMKGLARSTLQQAIQGDHKDSALHARWFLERTVNELSPPAQRTEVSGSGGGPLSIIIGSAPAGLIRRDEDDDE